MIISIFYICIGLFFLYIGAEWLIKASASIAIHLGIPPMLVGLTIIGYGTSTPELIVNLNAVLDNYNSLAVGNILGSNLFNMGFIGGFILLMHPISLSKKSRIFDIPIMALACLILAWVCWIGYMTIWMGIGFLVVLVGYTFISTWFGKNGHDITEKEVDVPMWQLKKCLPILPISIAGLIIGGNLLISGSVAIAQALNISESIIGLTIIAIGTSIPELATSILAAYRNHPQIALGNIIGSNIYNVFGVLGVTSLPKALTFQDFSPADLIAMLLVNLLFAFFVCIRGKAGRWLGASFLTIYLLFFVLLLYPYL